MSALPDEPTDPHDWDDEWNSDDWSHLNKIDRSQPNQESWGQWALRLVTIVLVLPVVLGVLVLLLILVF